jgi:polyhydroxybutyrate depolymerase
MSDMETRGLASRDTIPLSYDGLSRPYMLQAPAAPDSVHLPLLLELHGRGIDAERFDRITGLGSLAEEAGFALALPSALGEIWNDGRDAAPEGRRPNDVGYLRAVIDDATSRLRLDPQRIYVVGMSNGAAMAGRLACQLADRIAGIAQVAGTAGVGIVAGCRPARPVPILSIHGTADNIAPYGGGVRRSLLGHIMIRHAAGPSVGVDDWARFWVAVNGAAEDPVVTALPPDTLIRTWRGPTPSSDTAFYRVEGAGHTWPRSRFALPAVLFGRTSDTFDATRAIWEFLAAHRR